MTALDDRLAPGGDLAHIGTALRDLDAELARLAAAGAPPGATAKLHAARTALLSDLSVIDAGTPRRWRVEGVPPP